MNQMKNNFRYLLLLIHYWFPVLLGWSIAVVVRSATGLPILPAGFHLYLFGICAAYSLDRLLDNDDPLRPYWLTVALVLGVSVSVLFGLFLAIRISIQTLSTLLVFSIATLFYNRVKKFPFIKFLLVSIVWAWAGVALPFINTHWFAWQFWTMDISLPLVMLIASSCILCDFKDINTDGASGVHSLPVMFGVRNTVLVASVFLVITAVISYHEHRLGLAISSVMLIALAQFPSLLSLDAIGPLVVDALLVLPGLLIALHWS